MSRFDDIAQRYIATWNERDPAARRTAVEELFTPDARYTDPPVVAEDREAIAATIAEVQTRFPGFIFGLAGPVDGHHDQARFGWALGQAGAEAPIVGFDVVVVDADDRITSVLGFLDRVPALT